MAAFILDCSVAVSWLFPDERTPVLLALQDRLETEAALVPSHWFLEVANALALAEKRRRVLPAETQEYIAFVEGVEIEIDPEATDRAFDQVLPLCREHGLTAYDAMYLDLAIRRSLPLATLDDDLRRAATKAGVALLGR